MCVSFFVQSLTFILLCSKYSGYYLSLHGLGGLVHDRTSAYAQAASCSIDIITSKWTILRIRGIL